MLDVEYTTQFKRDLKLAKRQQRKIGDLQTVMNQIQNETSLSPQYKDHPLLGNWSGYRELHVENDWLLIYKVSLEKRTVFFVRVGSHSELFK